MAARSLSYLVLAILELSYFLLEERDLGHSVSSYIGKSGSRDMYVIPSARPVYPWSRSVRGSHQMQPEGTTPKLTTSR
jgi:hypothetical protein